MKDHHLKAWLGLVDTGSIRAAARHLRLSQAAVTKAIRELELDLDAPLIVRSSRGVTLTECGHQLTPRARLAQAQLNLARQDIAQLRGGKQGHVSVAVTPMAFLSVLPAVIRRFRQRMPLAELALEEGMMPLVLPALRDGRVDFAVAAPAQDGVGSDFHFEPLRMMETMVACRRGHPLENATEWEQLLGSEWLMYLSTGSLHSHMLEDLRCRQVPTPGRVVRVNTFGVSWNLMAHSDALLACPVGMLAVEPYCRQISRIPLRMPLPSIPIGILSLRDTPLSLAAGTLADLFRQAITSYKAAGTGQGAL